MEKIETLPYEIGKKYLVKYPKESEGGPEEMAVYEWSKNIDQYIFDCGQGNYYLPDEVSAEPLPEPQEQDRKPNPESYYINEAHTMLLIIGETDLAASLKSKHPEIWPVDWETDLIRTSLAFYKKCYHGEKPDGLIEEVTDWMKVCRNYIESKNERK